MKQNILLLLALFTIGNMAVGAHNQDSRHRHTKNQAWHSRDTYSEPTFYDGIYCHHCQYENSLRNKYCGSCKRRLHGEPCPECRTLIRPGYRRCGYCNYDMHDHRHQKPSKRQSYLRCDSCKRFYHYDNSSCPRCSHQDNLSAVRGPVAESPCLVGQFTKGNYKRYTLKIPIETFTTRAEYKRVLVDCDVTKHAVIVNTIKVRKPGGGYKIKPVKRRLKAGRNKIPITIPKGSTEIILSFKHGKDCGVKVYLET